VIVFAWAYIVWCWVSTVLLGLAIEGWAKVQKFLVELGEVLREIDG
jgi:hypothetical protein